jgi:hypothetical protein
MNMTIYAVEIAKRAVAVFSATFVEEADEYANSSAFRSSLTVLESEGKPLWDGKSTLSVREALSEEQDKWLDSRARALATGELEDDEDHWLLFLVPVIDPTDGYC